MEEWDGASIIFSRTISNVRQRFNKSFIEKNGRKWIKNDS